jgi:HAD superfamily hydrolase (TIGR01509 family)
MTRWPYIFFDVGNTLLFPNRDRMLAPLPAAHHPTLEQWQALERQTKRDFDAGMLTGSPDHGFWWSFHTQLLEERGLPPNGLRDAIVRNTQNSANWDSIPEGTREALQRIGRRHKISVISNADGRIHEVLARCGIADCFQSITDSGIVGQEKPHPAIFAAALHKMNAPAEQSLYIGDVYSVDYAGAKNAGMDAVLMDVSRSYVDRDLARVESLAELESWLEKQLR